MLMICPKADECKNKDRRSSNHLHNRCNPHPFLDNGNSCKRDCYLAGSRKSCPQCIPYIHKFKRDNRVQVLEKGGNCPLEKGWIERGDLGTIKQVDSNGDIGVRTDKGKFGCFKPHELQLIIEDKKEEIMYKPTEKIFTISDLINISPASPEEKSRFNKKMSDLGYRLYLAIKFDYYIPIANNHKCFIDWLIDEGIIEKIKEEIFYKRGDKFMQDGAEYLLTAVSHKRMLMINNNGKYWGNGAQVADSSNITEKEFNEIVGTFERELWEKLSDEPKWQVPVSRTTPLANAVKKVLEHILDKGSFTSPHHVGQWVKDKVDLWVNHK